MSGIFECMLVCLVVGYSAIFFFLMIRRPPRSTQSRSSAASDVYKRQDMGYLPEALVNYLVRLSWSHGDQEIFSRQELIDLFDIRDVGKSAAVFNPEKLLWLNHHLSLIHISEPTRPY